MGYRFFSFLIAPILSFKKSKDLSLSRHNYLDTILIIFHNGNKFFFCILMLSCYHWVYGYLVFLVGSILVLDLREWIRCLSRHCGCQFGKSMVLYGALQRFFKKIIFVSMINFYSYIISVIIQFFTFLILCMS